jgi:hypothetical protein
MALRDVWSQLDLVFDNGIGEPLSPWTVSADSRRSSPSSGCPARGSTTFDTPMRRSCSRPGVHVKAVSERLGHSSTSFTMDTYAAVIPSTGRAAADAGDQLFGEEKRNVTRWVQSGSNNALLGGSGRAFVLVDAVHPTGQYSKKCPQIDGHMVRLSRRHAKLRREGYRKPEHR